MCLFLETIKTLNGKFQHVEYHNRRFNDTRMHFFKNTDKMLLEQAIVIPETHRSRDVLYKCRIYYRESVESCEFIPYVPRRIKRIKIIYDDLISYPYKYKDRSCFNDLLAENKGFDDILIVKKGQVTDTSFSNVAFYDGSQWFTPDSPLLQGSCRARLLEEGKITTKKITLDELFTYKDIFLINAMNDLDDGMSVSMENVIP